MTRRRPGTAPLLFDPPVAVAPDENPNAYTVGLSQAEAEALVRGEVPVAVQRLLISLMVSMSETPAEAIASMRRRRARRQM